MHTRFLLVFTTIFWASCGGSDKTELIKVDGSSTVYPITEAVAEEFQLAHRGMRVTVGISGSGGGFKRFCSNETDVTNASRPIVPSEMKLCKADRVEFIELPVAYDGLAVVVHPDNDWCDYLTVEELRMIWEPKAQRKIKKWNQIRPEWPDKPINLYGPGIDSGTFDYFTEAITGEPGASRGDYTASEDDNVIVQGVASDANSLGFFGVAYYEENRDKLRVVPIDDGNPDNGDGPIIPSLETVKNGTYQPLSRPLLIYVHRTSVERQEVDKFVRFYLEHAGELTAEVGYVPLPDRGYQLALERYDNRVTGTMFKGGRQTVGVSVEALLQMQD